MPSLIAPMTTFFIVARCPRTRMLRTAVTSGFIAVGSVCSHAQAGVGAISQAVWPGERLPGCCSTSLTVVGSAGAVAIAILAGFGSVLWLGAGAYGLAAVVVYLISKR